MIRAPLAFLRRAPTLALLTRHIGHPVGMLVAANAPLAHCAECDLWLRPHESCLHMAANDAPRPADPSASGAGSPFHASEDADA